MPTSEQKLKEKKEQFLLDWEAKAPSALRAKVNLVVHIIQNRLLEVRIRAKMKDAR